MYKICIFISVYFYLTHYAVSYELRSEICKSLTGSFGLSKWEVPLAYGSREEEKLSVLSFLCFICHDKGQRQECSSTYKDLNSLVMSLLCAS